MLFLHRFRQTETSFGNVRCGIQVIYHFSELSVAIEKIFQQVKSANAHFSLENGAIDQISQQHSVSNLVHHKSLYASFVLKETLKVSVMKMTVFAGMSNTRPAGCAWPIVNSHVAHQSFISYITQGMFCSTMLFYQRSRPPLIATFHIHESLTLFWHFFKIKFK